MLADVSIVMERESVGKMTVSPMARAAGAQVMALQEAQCCRHADAACAAAAKPAASNGHAASPEGRAGRGSYSASRPRRRLLSRVLCAMSSSPAGQNICGSRVANLKLAWADPHAPGG